MRSRDVCKGIHILGLGNLGKFVAYALGTVKPYRAEFFRPTTLLFHRPALLDDWEAAGRSIRYSAPFEAKDGASQGEHPPATHFRAELHVQLPEERASFDVNTIKRRHRDVAIHPDFPIRYLIVATKAHATVRALTPIKHRLNEESHILFLQNGMGVIDQVSDDLFPDPKTRPIYLVGICHAGVYSDSPFSIVHAGPGHLLVGVVEPQSGIATSRHPLVRHLKGAHGNLLRVRELEPAAIRQAQLKKLVVNSLINPLTVMFNCENGRVFDTDEARERFCRLLLEAGAIVRALLPPGTPNLKVEFSDGALEALVKQVAQDTAKNTSSMLQDIRAGRPTEIDYINGYLVAEAQRLGLPHRTHLSLCLWIKELEAKIRKAGSSWDAESLDELVRQGRPRLARDPTATVPPSTASPDSPPTDSDST